MAALVAWYVASLIFGDQKPIFAAIAALIVVQPSINQSLGKAIERSVGTVLGVAIAFAATLLFGTSGWIVLVAVIAAIIIAWTLKLTPATASQIALSSMLVLALGSVTPLYALDRIMETILGAAVGLVINALIAPPVALEPANRAVSELGGNVAQILEDISAVLTRPTSYAVLNEIYLRSRALRAEYNAARATVVRAQESLRFNARRNKHTLTIENDIMLMDILAVLVTRTMGLSRAVRDHYDDSVIAEKSIRAIAEEFNRAGHDLRLLVRNAGLPAVTTPHPATSEIPALTAPISVIKPSLHNWVLIGFLMETLRLVRNEITGALED
jgi:uncharacterized membrane protein YgaE (UPF0421/DUF939 family)